MVDVSEQQGVDLARGHLAMLLASTPVAPDFSKEFMVKKNASIEGLGAFLK